MALITCPDCFGTKLLGGGDGKCSTCKGYGEKSQFLDTFREGESLDREQCPTCGGSGVCITCGGDGMIDD